MSRVDIREARLVGENLILKLRYADTEFTLRRFYDRAGQDTFRLIGAQQQQADCPVVGIPAHRVKAEGLPIRNSHLFARAVAHLYPKLRRP